MEGDKFDVSGVAVDELSRDATALACNDLDPCECGAHLRTHTQLSYRMSSARRKKDNHNALGIQCKLSITIQRTGLPYPLASVNWHLKRRKDLEGVEKAVWPPTLAHVAARSSDLDFTQYLRQPSYTQSASAKVSRLRPGNSVRTHFKRAISIIESDVADWELIYL
ncbi:uncharacterized protein LACBIDRAFT_329498 [Laccaria bicolor S238N-H82]|uniref:Predicted protein n=1 Tax=Laccaria bicolor (strain S238N-H82 / ATCC MYA-4686) TaxID=486041 RepID=B0DI80_LACBS|nr:uncharacterized protein LACBIDRAFT_329498 [Laccaria bicolor S238N-H82]EDR05632.1 predicted protein [Laccaria bicolor S238N-H82]|eukprot:XP_001883736.1 predicted protein [Laccaria bicolor S238N-H82]